MFCARHEEGKQIIYSLMWPNAGSWFRFILRHLQGLLTQIRDFHENWSLHLDSKRTSIFSFPTIYITNITIDIVSCNILYIVKIS